MGVASGIELGCSYELGSGWTRIGVLTRPRWGLGTVMTVAHSCILLIDTSTLAITIRRMIT